MPKPTITHKDPLALDRSNQTDRVLPGSSQQQTKRKTLSRWPGFYNFDCRGIMRCLSGDSPREWCRLLPWIAYCYNTSIHSSLKVLQYRVVWSCDTISVVLCCSISLLCQRKGFTRAPLHPDSDLPWHVGWFSRCVVQVF